MDLNVLSAGAAKALVESLQPQFTSQTGVAIHATFRAVGAIKEKLLAGEPCDVVILTAAQLGELARSGRVQSDSVAPLGCVATAIAVRAGEPSPEIGDPENLRRVLLAAAELYVPDAERATAGIHLLHVLDALHIHDELAPRLRSYPNGVMAMHELARSVAKRAIGCAQVTEIRSVAGVKMLGPLPRAFALETVYSVAVNVKAQQPALAHRLAALLTGPGASELRTRAGFEIRGSLGQ